MSTSDDYIYRREWHSSDELQRRLVDFHYEYARFPAKRLKAATENLEKITLELRKVLQETGVCDEFLYTGSVYEGIKVDATDLEFDIMVVLKHGADLESSPYGPLHRLLKPRQGNGYKEGLLCCTGSQGLLEPEKVNSAFCGRLQKAINRLSLSPRIKLRAHGPATQMDVSIDGTFRYSVDMVPTYVVDNEYLVAKPGSGETWDYGWRVSYSRQEKDLLKCIDSSNGCRKWCIRILKVLRHQEATLEPLDSYLIKTAVFQYTTTNDDSWQQPHMGKRFMDLLCYIADALDKKKLAHFFVPQFNLLGNMFSEKQRSNMADRLRELTRSKTQFYGLLDKTTRLDLDVAQARVREDWPEVVVRESDVYSGSFLTRPTDGAGWWEETSRQADVDSGSFLTEPTDGAHGGVGWGKGAAIVAALGIGVGALALWASSRDDEVQRSPPPPRRGTSPPAPPPSRRH